MALRTRSSFSPRGAAARFSLAICGLLPALVLAPHPAKAWWSTDWTYREAVTIDAGPKGAALAEDPGRMPVLLRLHDGNFKFEETKDDGGDLRVIASDDQTPLKFHIESFDPVLGVAFLWVDVPAIKTGATTSLWLYWGNRKLPLYRPAMSPQPTIPIRRSSTILPSATRCRMIRRPTAITAKPPSRRFRDRRSAAARGSTAPAPSPFRPRPRWPSPKAARSRGRPGSSRAIRRAMP